MRIGLAQLNTTVGDLSGNRRLILDAYKTLVAAGAELVVYPELVICGYPRATFFSNAVLSRTSPPCSGKSPPKSARSPH